jgi:L-lactate dehydrogenase complex protein LldG
MPTDDREKIFARISEALANPAHGPAGGPPSVTEQRRVLPAVGKTFEERLALFRSNAAELRADFHVVANRDELESRLRELRDAEGWKKVAAHNGELSGRMAEVLGLAILQTDGGFDKNELAACDVGITECDALVAQTGSVLVTSRSAGGRALSCLPPHHIVLARREQLVPDLPAAFELLQQKYADNYPSMISFITGPSRTGDIERILVLGAHGPKKLTIFAV